MHAVLVLGSLVGAGAVLAWRVRETTRPIDAKKILIPPLGMSTGLMMFVYPPTRIPVLWGAVAFLVGALLLSQVLVKTSKLTRQGDAILLQRSKAFLWILLGLVAIRFAARAYVEQMLSPMQTGSIFFLLAFGMIVVWRAMMYREYRTLAAERDGPRLPRLVPAHGRVSALQSRRSFSSEGGDHANDGAGCFGSLCDGGLRVWRATR